VAEPLTIEPQTGFGLATVMARKACDDGTLAECLGMPPAKPGRCHGNAQLTLVSTGPKTWLAYAEQGESHFAEGLQTRLAGLASISDQSGGYVLFRVTGANARRLLQRGVPIDLHPDAFPPGSAATTVIAHIGVILWQSEAADGFTLATFRSYATSLQHWLHQSAATL